MNKPDETRAIALLAGLMAYWGFTDGLNAAALGAITAYFATSALSAWLGGLPAAVSLLSLGMPTAGILFFLALPETRGQPIEAEDTALSRETSER